MSISEELNIVQWNVQNTTSAAEIDEHLRHISDTYGEPQITCLEEVLKSNRGVEGFAVNHHFREKYPSSPRSSGQKLEGITVESSFKRTHYVEIELSSGDSTMYLATSETRRMCQLVSYSIPSWGEEVHLAHVHLSPFVPGINSRQRKSELDQLVDIIREKAKKGRFILLGDFNMTPSSKFMQTLSDLDLVTPLNTTDATYQLRLGDRAVRKLVLDYIMVSKDLEGRATVLPSGPSDHNPTFAQIWRK